MPLVGDGAAGTIEIGHAGRQGIALGWRSIVDGYRAGIINVGEIDGRCHGTGTGAAIADGYAVAGCRLAAVMDKSDFPCRNIRLAECRYD